MSRLEKLIDELCPDGVEYKKIKDISKKITSGGTPKTDINSYYGGDIPWLRTQEIDFGDILDTGIKITQQGLDNSSAKWIPKNCVIIAMYGATVGKVGINKIPMTTNQACCNIDVDTNQALYRYVFYFLWSKYEYIKSLGQGSQTNINAQIVKEIVIPIPPLPVQEEIVRILDTFTELTTELAAELTMRKQQYEYYRDSLLTFGEEVEWRTISDIGELVRGNGLPKADFTESGVPAIHYGQIYTYYGNSTVETKSFVSYETAQKLKKVNYGDVIITNTSENLKDVGKALLYLGTEQAVTGGHATIFKPSNIILGKFFVYITQSLNFEKQKVKFAKGTKVIDVSANDISKILIPLPPLEEQQRIVDILDRFDALVNDIKTGLPAEIEARQKQYEYYRDKLLTFKKNEKIMER
ncbi:restriction endonuclease subunit S [Cetobacterium sp.]